MLGCVFTEDFFARSLILHHSRLDLQRHRRGEGKTLRCQESDRSGVLLIWKWFPSAVTSPWNVSKVQNFGIALRGRKDQTKRNLQSHPRVWKHYFGTRFEIELCTWTISQNNTCEGMLNENLGSKHKFVHSEPKLPVAMHFFWVNGSAFHWRLVLKDICMFCVQV